MTPQAKWNAKRLRDSAYREAHNAKQRLYYRRLSEQKYHGKGICFGGCGKFTANKILRMVDENGKWVEREVFYCGKC
jgi:hypothetical protein